jgi:hypothetical protein
MIIPKLSTFSYSKVHFVYFFILGWEKREKLVLKKKKVVGCQDSSDKKTKILVLISSFQLEEFDDDDF